MTADPHPFEWLAGAWHGSGTGEYPTIEPFAYEEWLEVTPVPGKPVARWTSRSADATSGEARHGETGYLRLVDGSVELVVAHSFGAVEIALGTAGAGALHLRSTLVRSAPSAKEVSDVERHVRVDGESLHYQVAMAAVGVMLTHHLTARLDRR